MAKKTYTVRVAASAPDITSEQAASWLQEQLASNTALAADPGAGERSLRLSLDSDQVRQGAQATSEPEATFLRRLIASHVPLAAEPRETGELKAEPKPTVLKGPFKLSADQVMPVVHIFEFVQSAAIRNAFHAGPEAIAAAAFSEDERKQLAVSVAEVANRRVPRRLVENIDLVGLAGSLLAIELRKIEAVRAAVALRQRQIQQQQTQSHAVPAGAQFSPSKVEA